MSSGSEPREPGPEVPGDPGDLGPTGEREALAVDARGLLSDMARALRSEYGARRFYRYLAGLSREPELVRVLERLVAEGNHQIELLRELMQSLGGSPRRGSFRRWVGSCVLLAATPVLGRRFALRVCVDAEWTVARWYGRYRAYLLGRGDAERARVCEELAVSKQRHANILQAWVNHGR